MNSSVTMAAAAADELNSSRPAADKPLEKQKKRKLKPPAKINAQEVIKTIENEARQAELEQENDNKKAKKKGKKVNFKDVSIEDLNKTPSCKVDQHEATPLKPKRGRKKKAEAVGGEAAPELVPLEAAEVPAKKEAKKAKKGKKTGEKKSSKRTKATDESEVPQQVEDDKDFKLELTNESAEISPPPPATVAPVEKNPEPTVATTEQKMETNEAPVEAAKEEEPPKPKRGGARIVLPKEVTSVIKIVTKENGVVEEQVEKVVTEVRKREAGPRIVIPVIINQQETTTTSNPKRKLADTKPETTVNKKIKDKPRDGSALRTTTTSIAKNETPSKPIKALAKPDFQSIHQKQAEGMESIDDYCKRTVQRHMTLTGGKPMSSSTPQQKALTISDITNSNATKLTNSGVKTSVPNRATSLNRNAMAASTTPKALKGATSSSNIPVLVKEKKPLTTTTTENEQNLSLKEAKTPTRKLIRDPSALNRSALKAKNDLNCSTDKQPQMPPQLASSSFVRRKSFDLNASLSRELHYKPYTGKLKPIDLEIKPIAPCSLSKLMTAAVTKN